MNVQTLYKPISNLSIDQFFDWVESKPDRYELVEGTPKLLPFVKLNHNRIVTNLVAILLGAIDRDLYEVATGDFAVQVGDASVRYADVMVFPAKKPGDLRAVTDAKLLIEVLSDSTAHVDFGQKLQEYQSLAELETYLIIDQDARKIWQWTREDDGEWPSLPVVVAERDASLRLAALALDVPLSEIYRNVS